MAGAARTYLDHNATSPLRPRARDAMLAVLDAAGNPSSVHAEGRAARAVVETARESVAALVGARPADVTFTSGGTEAIVTALTGAVEVAGEGLRFDRLLVGATEHACVLAGGRFPAGSVERLPVDGNGIIDPDALRDRLAVLQAEGVRAMVAVQAANNETGVIQPIADLAERVHAAGGVLVCDAVQAPGRMAFALADAGADAVVLSAHKLGGPLGAGALVTTSRLRIKAPLLTGGGQERGARAGTENVAAIAGFGAAAAAVRDGGEAERARLAGLRDAFETGLRARRPQAVVFGAGVARLANTSLVAIPGDPAETALIRLDLAGLAVSSGSACSSGKVRRSHVLEAMGVDEDLSRCAIRVSFGWNSTETDVTACLEAFAKAPDALSERPGRAAA